MPLVFSPSFCVVCVATLQIRSPEDVDSNAAARVAIFRIRPDVENLRYTIEPGTMCSAHQGMHNLWLQHTGRKTWPRHMSEQTVGKERVETIMKENRKHFQALKQTKGTSRSGGGGGSGCCSVM